MWSESSVGIKLSVVKLNCSRLVVSCQEQLSDLEGVDSYTFGVLGCYPINLFFNSSGEKFFSSWVRVKTIKWRVVRLQIVLLILHKKPK